MLFNEFNANTKPLSQTHCLVLSNIKFLFPSQESHMLEADEQVTQLDEGLHEILGIIHYFKLESKLAAGMQEEQIEGLLGSQVRQLFPHK